ncbi:hypothetical protein WN51_06278 [Melipona quadrifasciata]|uniref:Uncharacterized protein n=1 Tax=Melipona quadrifasciata TaxID=166423 RepID=A0A0M8ZQ76_9HYME|nr:hypothetical protein WN51_06278 [Melipona quadrifasciata]
MHDLKNSEKLESPRDRWFVEDLPRMTLLIFETDKDGNISRRTRTHTQKRFQTLEETLSVSELPSTDTDIEQASLLRREQIEWESVNPVESSVLTSEKDDFFWNDEEYFRSEYLLHDWKAVKCLEFLRREQNEQKINESPYRDITTIEHFSKIEIQNQIKERIWQLRLLNAMCRVKNVKYDLSSISSRSQEAVITAVSDSTGRMISDRYRQFVSPQNASYLSAADLLLVMLYDDDEDEN